MQNSRENENNLMPEHKCDFVRLTVLVPKKLRMAYRSKLAAKGETIQADINRHMAEMLQE